MKRNLLLCTTICSIALSSITFAADVIINGKTIALSAPPTIVNGRTLVPVRAIFEELGAEVVWDAKKKTITGTSDGKVIVMEIDETFATMQEKTKTKPTKIKLDTPATIINGNTYVPLRFVAESLNCDVAWDKTTQTVTVSSKAPVVSPTASAVKNAVSELESRFKTIEHLTYKSIDTMATRDALNVQLRYDATKTQSEFQDLLTQCVEEVISVAKKYNAPVFSIQVGIEDANGELDLYWTSHNAKPDPTLANIGDLYYNAYTFKKEKIPYTEVGNAIGIAMQSSVVKDLGVTMEAYTAIKKGMTKAEVEKIIGESGQEQSSKGDTSVYRWSRHFSNDTSKSITVKFSGAKVLSKSQVGL